MKKFQMIILLDSLSEHTIDCLIVVLYKLSIINEYEYEQVVADTDTRNSIYNTYRHRI